MKSAYFGFEVSLNNEVGIVPFKTTILNPIKLLGYQFDMGMRPMAVPPQWASDILVQCRIGPQAANPDFDTPVINNAQASPMEADTLFVAILKNWAGSPLNKSFVHPYLNADIPAGLPLSFTLSHSGTPMDFEIAGILFYE